MDDFTKNKLINSLIDVVDRFYELKDEQRIEESMRLKGFCEGISYTLIELGAIDKSEAKKIMSGLGVRREQDKNIYKPLLKAQLDRSNDEMSLSTKVDEEEIDLRLKDMHQSFVSLGKRDEIDLDLPTYLRKDRY